MVISVVIPCYNEEGNVARYETELLRELDLSKNPYEIIFVDDGSVDNTYLELEKLVKKYPNRLRMVQHEKNKGMACAIVSGINKARGEMLVTLDADLTFHPKDISKLLNVFSEEKADVVIGSHVLGGTQGIAPYRVFLSRCCNFLYGILLGKNITAVSPIFRLYNTFHLKQLNLNPRPKRQGGFDINAEILFRFLQQKKKVVEVPVMLGTRISGVSKMNSLKATAMHLRMLSKIFFWRVKSVISTEK